MERSNGLFSSGNKDRLRFGLKNPGFRPHYSIDEALSDSEVETVLSRLASEIAVWLRRQT